MLSQVMSCHVISRHIASYHVMSYHIISYLSLSELYTFLAVVADTPALLIDEMPEG